MLYEIIDEEGIVHSYTLRSRPKPILKKREFRQGDRAPEFVLNPGDIVWGGKPLATGRWLHSRELTRRPLVLVFYSSAWGTYGARLTTHLQALQQQALEAGAQMLVVTQTPVEKLKSEFQTSAVDFHLVYDKNNRLARLLGVYDPHDPVWDRVAGINEDVFSPGLFVISPQGKFLMAKLDKYFEADESDYSLSSILHLEANAVQVQYA